MASYEIRNFDIIINLLSILLVVISYIIIFLYSRPIMKNLLSKKPFVKSDYLLSGIVITWSLFFIFGVWSTIYRIIGYHKWMSDPAVVISFLISCIIAGSLHISAPYAIEGVSSKTILGMIKSILGGLLAASILVIYKYISTKTSIIFH